MASRKLTALPTATEVTTSDKIYIVDVSDTSESPQGTSKQAVISELPSSFAIPLTGTETDKPVTGSIEMNSGNVTSIFKKQGDSKWQIYMPDESLIGFINESIEDTEGTSFIVSSSAITVASSVSGFSGIMYSGNYEDNFQDSSLVNKGYVHSLLKDIADEIPDATDEASAISGLNSLLTALRSL